MSSISTGSVGAMGIAGSLAAANRAKSESTSAKADSAAQKFKVDQAANSETAGSIADTDMDQDRDADGRRLYHATRTSDEKSEAEQSTEEPPSQANPDAFGITGTIINFDA